MARSSNRIGGAARRPPVSLITPLALSTEAARYKTGLPKAGRILVTFVYPNLDLDDNWREVVRLQDETRAIISDNTREPLL